MLELLSQFLLRLSFGLAAAMLLVSPRQVSSGYYRNNLYVLLGMSVLAALVALGRGEAAVAQRWLPTAAAVVSYIGAACWLYERAGAGRLLLGGVAVLALAAAWSGLAATATGSWGAWLPVRQAGLVSSGLLLGTTTASMLLGHWYLNAPGMPLAPLVRLLKVTGAVLACHAVLAGVALLVVEGGGWPSGLAGLLLALRWLFGLVGAGVLLGMAWQTLKVPNTQSATGILYVQVIAVFLGELASLLLSADGLSFV